MATSTEVHEVLDMIARVLLRCFLLGLLFLLIWVAAHGLGVRAEQKSQGVETVGADVAQTSGRPMRHGVIHFADGAIGDLAANASPETGPPAPTKPRPITAALNVGRVPPISAPSTVGCNAHFHQLHVTKMLS